MKIVITANSPDLDAPASPIFGRCTTYILVDTETDEVEPIANPAISASGGAGVQAAQFLTQRGVQAVVTGNVGPKAFSVFQASGIPVYTFKDGSVRQAIQAYKEDQLSPLGDATVVAHTGMGGGGRRGRNR
jgi:predicted Fe-Mo cluster-binding NifX family protein